MARLDYDSDAAPLGQRTIIPDGTELTVCIADATVGTHKDETGVNLQVDFEVVGGHYAGVSFRNYYCLRAPVSGDAERNTKRERIGNQEFRSLRDACGLGNVKDSDELIDKTLRVEVGSREYGGNTYQTIAKYFDHYTSADAPVPPVAVPAQKAHDDFTPEWAK